MPAPGVPAGVPSSPIAIGPAIENGFYYDFELPRSLSPEDLEQIEARMRQHIKAREPFERREVGPVERHARDRLVGVRERGGRIGGEETTSSGEVIVEGRQESYRWRSIF